MGKTHYFGLLLFAGLGCTQTKMVEGYPDEFVGVGLELRVEEDFPEVVRTLAGGPAELAGLLPGDRILAVDGHQTVGNSLGDVVVRLRGQPDTQVILNVSRAEHNLIVVVRRQAMSKTQGADYRVKSQ